MRALSGSGSGLVRRELWDEAECAVAQADVYLVVGTRFLQRTALLLLGSCAEVLPRLW